jgi:hypothetical protein
MKKIIRISLLSASLAAGSSAAPFMAIGDGAELFLTGNLGVRADDNIFLARNSDSDLIFDIAPGVEITFGKNAQMKGSLTLVDSFSNYSDNSKLNTNLFAGAFQSNYDDGKLKLGFNLSYTELNQNSVDIRGLTRRDVFAVGGTTEVEISQLTKVGAGVNFNHENYKRKGYTDSDSLTVPIDFYYKWTEKTDLSFGYRYRDYKVDLGSDSTDHFFNVGARGEFSPKLKGRFAIGLNTRKLDRGGDDTQLGIDSSFSYEISPKTSFDFGISNDFGTSPQGQQQKNLTLFGSINSKISDEWAMNVGLNYRSIDYGTRTDDYIEGVLGGSYIVNANVKIIGAYTYRNYSSDIAVSEFKNNVFSVAANFRY